MLSTMDEQTIMERHAKFYDDLKRISEASLGGKNTYEELNLSRATIQCAYRDIKKTGFKGNIVDYLCWISTQFILNYFQRDGDMNAAYAVYEEDFLNMLRLFWKNPHHILDDKRINKPREIFDIITSIRYQVFLNERPRNTIPSL